MKRIIGIGISVLLLTLALFVPVFAETVSNGVQITIGRAEISSDGIVEVPVSVSSTEKFNSLVLFDLHYDSKAMTFVGFSETEETLDKVLFADDTFMENGDVFLAFDKTETHTMQICSLRFSVGEETECGAYPVTFSVLAKKASTVIPSGITAGEVAVNHAWQYHAAVPATCTAGGTVAYWHCVRCEKNFADENGMQEITAVETQPLNHKGTMQYHEAVSATCTTTGTVGYWRCTACFKNFADANGASELAGIITSVDPANHKHLEYHEAVEATCKTGGAVSYYRCEACGKNYSDANGKQFLTNITVPVDSSNHIRMTEYMAVPATCTAGGTRKYYHCDDCGNNYSDEAGSQKLTDIVVSVNPANHTGLTYHAAVPATCIAGGSCAYWRCEACGNNYSDAAGTQLLSSIHTPVDSAKHTELEYHKAVDAGCVSGGNLEYWHCKGCGNNYSDAAGTQTLVNTSTNAKHPKLTYNAAVSATCTKGGTVAYYHCDSCGGNYSDADGKLVLTTITTAPDTAKHPKLTYNAAVSATCTKGGTVAHYHCDSCGGNYSDAAGKTVLSAVTVAPDAGKHTDLSYYPAVTATCRSVGNFEYWRCGNCGSYFASAVCDVPVTRESLNIAFDENLHKHAGPFTLTGVAEPTCHTPGHSGDKVCACGDTVSKGDVIPVTGKHIWSEWTEISSETDGSTVIATVERTCIASAECRAAETRTKETKVVAVKNEAAAEQTAPAEVAIDVYRSDEEVEIVIENKALTQAVENIKNDSTATEAAAITIDVAAVAENEITAINQVAVPSGALQTIAEAAKAEDNNVSGLAVNLSAGSVSFDAAALGVIAEKANAGDVKMDMSTVSGEHEEVAAAVEETLTEHQTEAFDEMKETQTILAAVTLEVSAGNAVISGDAWDTGDAAAEAGITLSVPFTGTIENLADVRITYIDSLGKKDVYEAKGYDGAFITFTVPHLSTYIISIETNAELPIITQPENISVTLGEEVILTVDADQPSKGHLTCEWFRAVNAGGESVGKGESYTVPTDTVGTTQYYVVVTNTDESATNNKTASVSSELITVTVVPPEEEPEETTYQISGSINISGATVELYQGEELKASDEDGSTDFTFTGLSAGEYTIKVSKSKYVPRTYIVQVGPQNP